MNARSLLFFVVLADELHFSRAASRLGVTQSAVSVRIRALERELGVRLFERSTRRVKLTDAGGRLLQGAHATLAALEDVGETLNEGEVRVPRLQIGISTAARHGIADPVLDRYERDAHGPHLSVRTAPSGCLLRELARFRLDVVITFCAPGPPGLRRERLFQARAAALVPADHGVAQSSHVTLNELSVMPLVLIEEADSAGFNAVALAACHAAGTVPELVWMPREESIEVFRRSRGFTFVTPGAAAPPTEGIAVVDIDGAAPTLFFDVLWRKETEPLAHAFLAACRAERDASGWLSQSRR